MQRRRAQQLPEPNPLRDLGDAMEQWKAALTVDHDAPNQPPGTFLSQSCLPEL